MQKNKEVSALLVVLKNYYTEKNVFNFVEICYNMSTRTQCKVVPIIGRVTYVEFFYAQICAIGGF